MSKGSGTRSGMLWEVERILCECKELGALPQVLCMENVPQVHGSKNITDFKLWTKKLEDLGYKNYYADINATSCLIPQNRKRCFMVSLLDNCEFKFPQKLPLELRLKDLLEDSVDEKYYLSDAVVDKLAFNPNINIKDKCGVDLCDTKSSFREVSNTIKSRYDCGYEHFSPGPTGIAEPQLDVLAKTEDGNNFNSVYSENGISPTLLARDYKDPVRVGELKQVGQIYPNSGNPQAGRVYDKDGLSPCLDTCQGGNREVKIVENNCSELQKEVCNRALDYLSPNDVIDYTFSNSRMSEMDKGFIKTKNSQDNSIMNTLTTNADKFGVCVKDPKKETILKRQLCNKLIEENKVQEGDIIRHSYTNSRFDSFHIENKENHDCCATLTTRPDCIGYVENQEQKPCPTLDTRCDCLGVVVNDKFNSMYTETEKQLFTKDGDIRRYINSDIIDKFNEGQMATTSYPNGYGHGSRTHNESISLNTIDRPSVKQNLRIRKLTPKECFRLQGVKDEDFEKIAKNQSNSSLYHLAGDSICTTCLMAIFGSLLGIEWQKHFNPSEWWNN